MMSDGLAQAHHTNNSPTVAVTGTKMLKVSVCILLTLKSVTLVAARNKQKKTLTQTPELQVV